MTYRKMDPSGDFVVRVGYILICRKGVGVYEEGVRKVGSNRDGR